MRIDRRTATALGTLLAGLVLALVSWGLSSGGDTGTSGGSSAPSATALSGDGASGASAIAEAALPSQARQTLALIDDGGPFPYPDHDGGVFGNYEGVLPAEPSGYYHEYTVKDPAESDRGPWRIITGSSGEFYWTADHYAHVARIDRS